MEKPPFLVIFLVIAMVFIAWLFLGGLSQWVPSVTSTPTNSVVPTVQTSKEIEVYLPTTNTKIVGTKFIIYGKGRGFENTLNYRVSDGDGKQLYLGSFMTTAPDAGIFGYFHQEVDLNKLLKNIPPIIRLDVYEASAKDGSDLHKTSFLLEVDQFSTSIFSYFHNINLDPEFSCEKVFALPRLVLKTQEVLRAATEQLLVGLTPTEKKIGFSSSIKTGSKLNSVKIQGKTAYLDFNSEFENTGGSCNVIAIRSQVTSTARQFANVENVIISIDGRTDGILQP